MVSLPALARREDAVAPRASRSRLARRAGWTPAVLAHPGYGSGGRVRVLGRVLLAPAGDPSGGPPGGPGWQRFLTLESAGAEVAVEVAGRRTVVRSDDDGLVDATLDVDLPDVGALPVRLPPATGRRRGVVHLASPDAARGVVCDIDDTVLVTGIATPLRAAWRTFVQPMTRRQAVPGMARLLRELTAGAPHVPVVYLSNGPWNLAGPLGRFLERSGFPPGALLLTDWGPTPTRWFRDGRAHKRTSLQRLAADLPGVRWTLVGDTGEHDPALYEEFARAQPDRVRAVLLRDTTGGGSGSRAVRARCRCSTAGTATPSPPRCPTGLSEQPGQRGVRGGQRGPVERCCSRRPARRRRCARAARPAGPRTCAGGAGDRRGGGPLDVLPLPGRHGPRADRGDRLQRREGALGAGPRHRPRLGQQQVGGLGGGVGDQHVEADRHPRLGLLRRGPERAAVPGQRGQPRLRVAGHPEQRAADDDRQAELGGDLQAAAGGQHVQRDGPAGCGCRVISAVPVR